MRFFQARILEWVAISFTRDPRIKPASLALAGRCFTTEPPGKPDTDILDWMILCSGWAWEAVLWVVVWCLAAPLVSVHEMPGASLPQVGQSKRPPGQLTQHCKLTTPKNSYMPAAAAAAESLQSCPTLCDPVPGILQARTLEWIAMSFSNAWKWKVKVKSLSPIWLFGTPWTTAHQAPPSMGFSRQECWSGVPLPSPVLPNAAQLRSLPYTKDPEDKLYTPLSQPPTPLTQNTVNKEGQHNHQHTCLERKGNIQESWV